ncbi:MAG TPA: SURF1 family protein [Gammaproteobacteria bacterium]
MNDKQQRWNLSFWPVLAFVLVLPGLVWLGVWQVQRGIEKQELHDAFRLNAASEDIDDATALPLRVKDALPKYSEIRLRGRYLNERTFLLDNMSSEGRPGHHVLTPFRPEGMNHVVIVDRGWRAGITRRRDVPAVPPAMSRTVQGKLAPFPQPGLELEGKPAPGGEWPRVVQFPDAADLSAQLGIPVADRRLLLDANAADGFVRDWKPPGIPPARHYAYAVQWFGLAIALIVIFIVMARPRRDVMTRPGRERKPEE